MKGRVLVVEDNAYNLELVTYLLEASDYCVVSAGDGASGLRLVRESAPDIVLCDLQLPVMDGYALARAMKAEPALRAIPLVAVTAFAMAGDRDKGMAAGFDGYLQKPIDPATFVGEMEAFLAPRVPGLTPPSHPEAPRTVAAPAGRCAGRLLVVDNLQANLDFASSLLEFHGYRVDALQDAHEALRRARMAPPDLILSDVAMPAGDGFEFLRAVRDDERLSDIPFVLLTSTMIDERDRRRGLALGATRYLTRPIEPEELLREIESCMPVHRASNDGDHPDRR